MKNKIAIIGTYLPRKCGIATFSSDLFKHVNKEDNECWVIALNDYQHTYKYPSEVKFEIRQNIIRDYIAASEFINLNQIDAVCLQHEYGIFGGEYGRFILELIKRLNAPLVTTLHTVLDEPTHEQKEILREIANCSQQVIVMSKMGKKMLAEIYGIDAEKIKIIGHGIHDIKKLEIKNYREKLNLEDKKILLTFGLLSKNKGIETVIKSLPSIVEKHPEVVYIILGASHPHVVKNDGEDYRNYLIKLTEKLNLEKNVIFVDRFVSNDELFAFLASADVYVIPYLSKKQITSGTLVYAMGAHNAMVSTPFWHAEEALADDRGIFFDFHDSAVLSDIINDLLDDETKLKAYQNKASNYAENYLWENIGNQYLATFKEASHSKKNSLSLNQWAESDKVFPELNLNHLCSLTDDTGILQHARYHIPNRNHGYCLDDNARALLLMVLLKKKLGDDDERIAGLFKIYLSFIDYAYNPKIKKFRNFMSYNRVWLEESGSEDSQGRAIWALGNVYANTYNSNILGHLENLFNYCLDICPELTHPRAISYSILGLSAYLKKPMENRNHVLELLVLQSKRLYKFFEPHLKNDDWLWYDDRVTYGNTRIAEAMLRAGNTLNDDKLKNAGFKLLDWLIEKQFKEYFSPIGNNGWLSKDDAPQFDQQPIEAHGMIDACIYAAALNGSEKYKKYAKKTFDWFLGNNVHGLSLYDFSTGGCRDGLHLEGLNKNQGAESTLAWLSSLVQIRLHF